MDKIVDLGHAFLFDMDGVLVDSEPVILEAAMLGLKEYGVNAEPEDFKPFIGAGEDRFIGGVVEKYGVPFKLEMKKRVYDIYDAIVTDKIKTFDEILDVLQAIKDRGLKMALASSADHRKIKANLTAAKIPESYFEVIVGGEDVERKKPAPDIYLFAANKINVAPENCVVVEDAVNGIRAAKSAGMKCIAIASSFPKGVLMKENPDFVFEGIKDLLRSLLL